MLMVFTGNNKKMAAKALENIVKNQQEERSLLESFRGFSNLWIMKVS